MEQRIFSDISQLSPIFAGKKVLLVCGRSFDGLGLSLPFDVIRFSGFSPNPRYEDICRGVELCRKENCGAILAVGGGSAMDTAKCIKLFSTMDPAENYLRQEFRDNEVLLAAIPTTAGTGSESTRHAVIYYKAEKQSVSHPSLIPQAACLIPAVLEKLPLYQKKCTLLDALGQAIESWWSVSSTEESVRWSRMAIELIRDNWRPYLLEGDAAAAEKILLAANYAGRAINITATTAAHAMSYKLTSLYGIPHGHAVALCLAQVWEYMLGDVECTDSRGIEHLRQVFADLPVDLEWYKKLLETLELTRPAAENREEELQILVSSVNPLRLRNNPALLDRATLKAMYERILR